ncbi:MAG: hypothetical protein P9L99_17675 [Candidatus Lernaella stagnicola]|nr:hypothetical protein [Candidatus Lernaella stagnicola]
MRRIAFLTILLALLFAATTLLWLGCDDADDDDDDDDNDDEDDGFACYALCSEGCPRASVCFSPELDPEECRKYAEEQCETEGCTLVEYVLEERCETCADCLTPPEWFVD